MKRPLQLGCSIVEYLTYSHIPVLWWYWYFRKSNYQIYCWCSIVEYLTYSHIPVLRWYWYFWKFHYQYQYCCLTVKCHIPVLMWCEINLGIAECVVELFICCSVFKNLFQISKHIGNQFAQKVLQLERNWRKSNKRSKTKIDLRQLIMGQASLLPVVIIAPLLVFTIYWIFRFAYCALKRFHIWKLSLKKNIIALSGVGKQNQEQEAPVLPPLYWGLCSFF